MKNCFVLITLCLLIVCATQSEEGETLKQLKALEINLLINQFLLIGRHAIYRGW